VTPEQQELVEKARDSLEAARLLHDHGHWGFAAARAYYTMFYMAEALLLGEGLSFSKHTAVHAAFGKRYAKTGTVPAALHKYLIQGMDLRHIGDYATSPVSEAQSEEQIARADEFLRVVEALLTGAETA